MVDVLPFQVVLVLVARRAVLHSKLRPARTAFTSSLAPATSASAGPCLGTSVVVNSIMAIHVIVTPSFTFFAGAVASATPPLSATWFSVSAAWHFITASIHVFTICGYAVLSVSAVASNVLLTSLYAFRVPVALFNTLTASFFSYIASSMGGGVIKFNKCSPLLDTVLLF
jgi:hypothetical protein